MVTTKWPSSGEVWKHRSRLEPQEESMRDNSGLGTKKWYRSTQVTGEWGGRQYFPLPQSVGISLCMLPEGLDHHKHGKCPWRQSHLSTQDQHTVGTLLGS